MFFSEKHRFFRQTKTQSTSRHLFTSWISMNDVCVVPVRHENCKLSKATKKLNSALNYIANARIDLDVINHKLRSKKISPIHRRIAQKEKMRVQTQLKCHCNQKFNAAQAMINRPIQEFHKPSQYGTYLLRKHQTWMYF